MSMSKKVKDMKIDKMIISANPPKVCICGRNGFHPVVLWATTVTWVGKLVCLRIEIHFVTCDPKSESEAGD